MSNCYIDIGGTYTKFLYNGNYFRYKTDIVNPLKLVKKFLSDKQDVKNLYIAIAGFYNGDYIIFKKIKHSLKFLKKRYKIFIMNDLEALSFDNSKTEILLKSSKKFNKERKIFIAIGTGLGVSIVIKDQHIYTELGYLKVSQNNKFEKEFLSKFNKKDLSYQNLLSGKGLKRIYKVINNKSINNFDIIDKDKKTIKIFYYFLFKYISELIYLLPDEIILSGGVILNTINYFDKKNLRNFGAKNNYLGMYPSIKINKNYYAVLSGLENYAKKDFNHF